MEIKKINYGKLTILDIFKDWYRVPSYQRHYVWDTDNVMDLLYDFKDSWETHPDDEYFLGSYIYQGDEKEDNKDLLDGQQRITTLFLLFAYLRDYGDLDENMQYRMHNLVFQDEDKLARKSARVRLQYEIRGDVGDFIHTHIVKKGVLNKLEKWSEIEDIAKNENRNVSINHICNTLVTCREFFEKNPQIDLVNFLAYILNNVVMIYISASTLEDAFRLFSVMNDRGLKLSHADILKSSNLEHIQDKNDKAYMARKWEEIQEDLGENFDRFLSYVRTMLLRTRQKKNLLDEFDKEIFPKGIIKRGAPFFDYVFKAYKYYSKAIEPEVSESSYRYVNLINILKNVHPSTDWIPVVMYYYSKFGEKGLYDFTSKMIHKNIADIVCGLMPSTRIENLSKILEAINTTADSDSVINNKKLYKFDQKKFMTIVNMDMYGRKCTKTILLLLELHYQSLEREMGYGLITIEHILPQNPREKSEWTRNYTPEQRRLLTHKIGNLCLLTRKKNTSFGNMNFQDKKNRYFYGQIDTFPRTLLMITNHNSWTPSDLEDNQRSVLKDIREIFEIDNVSSDFDDVKKDYYISKKRQINENYGKPWTEKDEDQLLELYNASNSIADICRIMGRNRGGIISRLRKLGIDVD